MPDLSSYSYIDINGSFSDPQPFLCLHGYADTHDKFSPLISHLPQNRRLVALSLPYNNSSSPCDLDDLTDYVAKFIDAAKLPPVILVGFSLGGLVATHLAALYPQKVATLFLLSSSPNLLVNKPLKYLHRLGGSVVKSKNLLWFISQILTSSLIQRRFAPKRSQAANALIKERYYSIYNTLYRVSGHDLTEEFCRLSIPKTIVLAQDDSVLPWSRYAKSISQLSAAHILMDAGGHGESPQYWQQVSNILFN